jgi:hypothetical protein
MLTRSTSAAALLIAVLALGACSASKPNPTDPDYMGRLGPGGPGDTGSMFGEGGLSFGTGVNHSADSTGGGGLGVNAFLWRGALDTLGFMPLASADPFGGVIITDWYQPPASSGERFKATAYILGRQLRADGVRVSVFRQVQQGGAWVDAPVGSTTATDIENKVLSRARELRTQSASGS